MEKRNDYLNLFMNKCRMNEKTAFEYYPDENLKSISYAQFSRDILTAAAVIRTKYGSRNHLGIISRMHYDWFVTFFAILYSGNTAVLIDENLPAANMNNKCCSTDVSVVFMPDDAMKTEFDVKIEIMGELLSDSVCSENTEPASTASNDPAVIIFSSGTTGKTKAVVLAHRSIAALLSKNIISHLNEVNRMFLCLPMYHIGGLRCSFDALASEAAICINRSLKYVLQDLKTYNADYAMLVPSIFEMIAKMCKRAGSREKASAIIGDRLDTFVLVGAKGKTEPVKYMIEAGFDIWSAYGLTESASFGTLGRLSLACPDSIGSPLADYVTVDLKEQELMISGSPVMLGYYQNDAASQEVLSDTILHTGDLAVRDENNVYSITGRKKNIIILSNGENVCPEELESELLQSESVIECMVYEQKDRICADIFSRDRETAEKAVEEINRSNPTYRQIKKTNYLSEPLKKSAMGKIIRGKTNERNC